MTDSKRPSREEPAVISSADLPLAGVRVLDLSFLLPGPFCTQLLADLGATVFKVEPFGGDPGRDAANGSFWTAAARNKHSIAINLKTDRGRELCLRLADTCDVVIEGFRPGTVERLGLGADDLMARNPRLVYCSLSGFGRNGPLRDEPGHDVNYLASAGALAYSGHWSERGRRSGIPLADLGSGSLAAVAILAALSSRDRNGGTHIDMSLRDVAMSMAAVRAGPTLDFPNSEQWHLWPTNDIFECSDGVQLALGVVEQRFWDRFRIAVSDLAPDLLEARYDEEAGRRLHGDDLSARLQELFASRPAQDWVDLLVQHDVPAQPVLDFDAAIREPQTVARGLVAEHDGRRYVRFPAHFDGRVTPVSLGAADVGEHTSAVLRDELDLDAQEIEQLFAEGVVVDAGETEVR